MGNSSSQTVKEYVTNNVSYSQIVSAELDLANKTSVSTNNLQNFELNVGGEECPPCCKTWDLAQQQPRCVETWPPTECIPATLSCGGNLVVKQTIDQDTQITQQIDSEFAQQMSAQLQNAAQADIQNAMKQMQENDPGWLGEWGNKTKQDVETSITNEISQNLQSDTVLKLVNQVLINTVNSQQQNITVCGVVTVEEDCRFVQGIGVKVVVQNILSSLADQVSKGELTNKFYTQVQNKLIQQQEGAIGALLAMIGKLGELGIILLVVGGIVVFLFIAGIALLVFFKGGGRELSTISWTNNSSKSRAIVGISLRYGFGLLTDLILNRWYHNSIFS